MVLLLLWLRILFYLVAIIVVSKTTLGENLAILLHKMGKDSEYVHSPGPKSKEELTKFMEDNLFDGHECVRVFDRFPIIEEEVYGNLLRGKNMFDDEVYNKSILDEIDGFVFCNPGLFRILDFGDREQMDGVEERALDLIDKYNRLAYKLSMEGRNVVEYNYICEGPSLVWLKLVDGERHE